MRPLNRIEPVGPVSAYKTYGIRSPRSTHTRPATCAEAGCKAHVNGWQTVVDEGTGLGMAQAAYIRAECRTTLAPAAPGLRRYVESRADDGRTVFTFPAGQTCFPPSDGSAAHRVPLGRPELFIVRGGDWRAVTSGVQRHDRPEHWVEDFAIHQDQLATRINRG